MRRNALRRVTSAVLALALLWPVDASLAIGVSGPRGGGGKTLRVIGNSPIHYPRRIVRISDVHINWAFGGGLPNLGDTLYNSAQLGAFVDTVNVMAADSIGVDAVCLGGDWAWDIMLTNNRNGRATFDAIIGRLTPRLLPTVGNHDMDPADTLAHRPPAESATGRFGAIFRGSRWYSVSLPAVEYFSVNNNANVDVSSLQDYRMNNPTTYDPPSGGVRGVDFDGITNPQSPQRVAMRRWLARRDHSKWAILEGHRAIYGTESGNVPRHNLASARTGTGYCKEFEDSMAVGESGVVHSGDEHVTYVTEKAHGGALVPETERGAYYLSVQSGSGLRLGDTTSVFAAPARGYRSYYFRNSSGQAALARTSEGIVDTTTAADGDLRYAWNWQEEVIWGNTMEIRTHRVFTYRSTGHSQYPGHLHSRLIDRQFITRRAAHGDP